LDLERGGMRGRTGRERAWRERRFVVLGKNKLLGFLGTLSSFQTSLGASHKYLGSDVTLEVIDKALSKNVSYMF
jgi:hypothetical protein